MLSNFEASFIYYQKEEDAVTFGLADDEFNTINSILLVRTIVPSEQDIALGHDVVHITVNDQIRSCYGGLLQVQVTSDHVIFNVDDNAANILQVASKLIVDIKCIDIDLATLTQQLKGVCGNYVDVEDN